DQVKQGRIAADIIFVIKDLKHELFTRNGDDLEYIHTITEIEALRGYDLKIPTLDGTLKRLNSEKAIPKNRTQKLIGLGLPCSKDPSKRGNLIVKFNVIKDPTESK